MTLRTYEADSEYIEAADDLDELEHHKPEGWGANSIKARLKQLRFKKHFTLELLRKDCSD